MKKIKLGSAVVIVVILMLIVYGGIQINNQLQTEQQSTLITMSEEKNRWENNRVIIVDACDMRGKRQASVKVDIGYENRQYFSFTNEHGQLVRVQAAEISLQKKSENLTEKGRYCSDEAHVSGTQRSDFDQGHVIADSLGGVSNAYNITPQATGVNRYGEQAKMEEEIRKALFAREKVTDFVAEIEYQNTQTQIPQMYRIKFKIEDKQREYNFENK